MTQRPGAQFRRGLVRYNLQKRTAALLGCPTKPPILGRRIGAPPGNSMMSTLLQQEGSALSRGQRRQVSPPWYRPLAFWATCSSLNLRMDRPVKYSLCVPDALPRAGPGGHPAVAQPDLHRHSRLWQAAAQQKGTARRQRLCAARSPAGGAGRHRLVFPQFRDHAAACRTASMVPPGLPASVECNALSNSLVWEGNCLVCGVAGLYCSPMLVRCR